MSPLWRRQKLKQLEPKEFAINKFNNVNKHKINNKRPSPKRTANFQCLARGENSFRFAALTGRSIKGISLFTFFCKGINASMTVEAAVVLPLFLFFFLNLSCAVEVMRLHGNLQLALWEVGSRLSVYGYALESGAEKKTEEKSGEEGNTSEEENATIREEICDIAFSYGYVRNEMVKYTGEDYLNASPLTYGADGLQFLESEIFDSKDIFEITVTYSISPWFDFAGFRPFRMANRYYGHIWNGYEIPGASQSADGTQDTVYVAKNGKVYHEDRECIHLKVSVQSAPIQEIDYCRNESGSKYTLCQKCNGEEIQDVVYITEDGRHYHYNRECSGLKRTVYSMLRAEAQGYRPCKSCAAVH